MQTLRASKFGLDPSRLSDAILDVLDSLTTAGYDAYIVGGGVRDLLLDLYPKDFDAVTNATPAQIKSVFGKRCRIIGRRFELAHVYSGRDMIEVATFRAPPRQGQTTAAGMITRDNAWGTIKQDFQRRDLSINSMYYQPREDVILDFCHAMDDVQAKRIRFLGDTIVRIQEDPVRMMRVVRFAAKLNFEIDSEIVTALTPQYTRLLLDVSAHRLFDEVQKMFTGGHLLPLMHKLVQHNLWSALFGQVPARITPFIELAAQNTDTRINAGKTINPAFFYAALLWERFLARVQSLVADGMNPALAWTQAGQMVLAEQEKHTAIPRFSQNFIREVWELQPRLIQPKPRQAPMLAMHPRFRAGFDFLYLRERSGDTTVGNMGTWWHDYQHLDNDSREQAITQLNRAQQRQKKPSKQSPIIDVASTSASKDDVAITAEQTIASVAMSTLNTNAYGELELIAVDERKAGRNRKKRAPRATLPAIDDTDDSVFYATRDESEPTSKQDYAADTRRNRPFQRRRRSRDLSTVNMGPRAEQAAS